MDSAGLRDAAAAFARAAGKHDRIAIRIRRRTWYLRRPPAESVVEGGCCSRATATTHSSPMRPATFANSSSSPRPRTWNPPTGAERGRTLATAAKLARNW